MPKSTKDTLGDYPVMRAPTRKEDPYAADEQEWINSLPTDRMGNKIPVMRAPTWKEKLNDFVTRAYESVAEQPLVKLADAFGFTEFKDLANPKPRPRNIDEVAVQGRSPGELVDAPLAKAGLPFMHYAEKVLPKGFIAHGSPRASKIERFDPSRYDKYDVLGWLTHGAENTDYANKYAEGIAKHASGGIGGIGAGVLPLKLEAKNVLDLVDPNIDDMSQTLAALDPYDRRVMVESFKAARRAKREMPLEARDIMNVDPGHHPIPDEAYVPSPPITTQHILDKLKEDVSSIFGYGTTKLSPKQVQKELKNFYKWYKTPYTDKKQYRPDLDPAVQNLPAITLAERLRLNPEQMSKLPYDAIRYNDMHEKSWAWPETTPVKSIFGHDFTPDLADLAKKDPKPTRRIFLAGESGPAEEVSKDYFGLKSINSPTAAPEPTPSGVDWTSNESHEYVKNNIDNYKSWSQKYPDTPPEVFVNSLATASDKEKTAILEGIKSGSKSGSDFVTPEDIQNLADLYFEGGKKDPIGYLKNIRGLNNEDKSKILDSILAKKAELNKTAPISMNEVDQLIQSSDLGSFPPGFGSEPDGIKYKMDELEKLYSKPPKK